MRKLILFLLLTALAAQAKNLTIYFIDVEGGQSTLIVTPQGQSLLVDTGWPDHNNRDADRILAAAKDAGLKQIDYVLITHYHIDHVGGAPQLASRIHVGTWVDHGPNQEDSDDTRNNYAAYEKLWAGAHHLVLKPGDKLPLKGVNVEVLAAAGEHITSNVNGGGEKNSYCAGEPAAETDPTENARSLGVLLTFGKFRFLDLGDLTKQKEIALVCPVNRIGTVDLYLTTHHGLDLSNSRAIVDAIHPRVAVMNNGAHKGAKPAAWEVVQNSPGLQDLWQLHTALDPGAHNVDEQKIANLQEKGDEGKYIKATAESDGTFTIVNSRNDYSKTYRAVK